MATATPLAGGAVRLQLEPWERPLLARVATELREILSQRRQEDPVDRRLFPDASDDPAEAAGFRDLVERDLVAAKLDAIGVVEDGLEGGGADLDLDLGTDEVDAWLRALTDLRLALGTRLEVDAGTMAAEPDPSDPRAPALAVLGWLGWLQEMMLAALAGDDEGHP